MKCLSVLAALMLMSLAGCVAIPDAQVSRVQFDDLADEDGDGVINQRDACAGSPDKSLVENDGCALWSLETRKEMFTVDFDYDRALIRDDQRETISRLVTLLKEYPRVQVELVGDTSPEGEAAYNKALAERRVDTLAAELLRLGLEQPRIRRYAFQAPEAAALTNRRERRVTAILHLPAKQVENAWSIYSTEEALGK
jgi:outer membrane protein OmpA-like peptidoglycan-associated protein